MCIRFSISVLVCVWSNLHTLHTVDRLSSVNSIFVKSEGCREARYAEPHARDGHDGVYLF